MKYFKTKIFNIGVLALAMLFYPCLLKAQQDDACNVRIFKKHTAPVKAVAFSPDGKLLASGGDDKTILLWDLQSGEVVGNIQNSFPVKAIQFTSDGNILAACGSEIKLLDRQGKLIRKFGGYTTDIWSMSYNAPTQCITAGSYAKSIKVWNFLTGKLELTLEGHEKSCLPVCFNPAGDLIASGSLDKSVRLWDAKTGKLRNKMELHSENVFAVAFHPSGKYFASASADKTIRLWNAETGEIIRTFTGHKGAIFDVQFSSDGNHMLSCDADKAIILWETATGKKVYTFTGHTAAVNSVRFSSDGSGFVSASDDQTVRYWLLDKKLFLAGSYFEKEIEKEATGSPLFTPRGNQESRQDFSAREAKADKFMDSLYEKYFRVYQDILSKIPVEPETK